MINDFEKDEEVEIVYKKVVYKGTVASVYGDTVNVSWEGKRSAFYFKDVKRINSKEQKL
jgi:hypothetical protein